MNLSKRVALGFVMAVALLAIFAGAVARNSYSEQFREAIDAPPSLQFPLGTDELGRDRFARLLWGTRISLLLAPAASLITTLLAASIGGTAGYLGGRWEKLVLAATDLFLSLPWLFLLLAVRTGWFPTRGLVSVGADAFSPLRKLRDIASHLVLPVLVLALTTLPLLVRHVRAAVSEVLDAPFLRTARGHGIGRRRLLYRYALPAAANPLISLLGLSIGALLGGSLLVEVVMGWPGLGPLLVEAILSRDLYVVIGGVLLSTLLLVFGNFVADLLLYWADPRIRPEPAP